MIHEVIAECRGQWRSVVADAAGLVVIVAAMWALLVVGSASLP